MTIRTVALLVLSLGMTGIVLAQTTPKATSRKGPMAVSLLSKALQKMTGGYAGP